MTVRLVHGATYKTTGPDGSVAWHVVKFLRWPRQRWIIEDKPGAAQASDPSTGRNLTPEMRAKLEEWL